MSCSPKTRDSEFAVKLIVAHRMLAWLYASKGRMSSAIQEVQMAADHAEHLFAIEPGNSIWI